MSRKTPLMLAEEALELQYLNKFVKYEHPGRVELYGRVDRIAIDNSRMPFKVIVMVDMQRFESDINTFNTLITLL